MNLRGLHLCPPGSAALQRDVEEHHRREHDEHSEREGLREMRVVEHVAAVVRADQDRNEIDALS